MVGSGRAHPAFGGVVSPPEALSAAARRRFQPTSSPMLIRRMTTRAIAVPGSSTSVVKANVTSTITADATASTSSTALAPVSPRTRRWPADTSANTIRAIALPIEAMAVSEKPIDSGTFPWLVGPLRRPGSSSRAGPVAYQGPSGQLLTRRVREPIREQWREASQLRAGKKPVHVTPHEEGWAVRREGASRAIAPTGPGGCRARRSGNGPAGPDRVRAARPRRPYP